MSRHVNYESTHIKMNAFLKGSGAYLLAYIILCQFWLPFPTRDDHLKYKKKGEKDI